MLTEASHASIAVAFPKSGIEPHVIGLTTVGQVIIGAVLSCMTIVLLQLDVLPQSSTAVHVLVTLLSCGHKPAVVISKKVTSTNISHASRAVGVPNDGVDPHSIGLTTTGHVITGGVLS